MIRTNLMTVKMTANVTSTKLTTPADRIGLGFGAAQVTGSAYPADSSLSPALFPAPHNPEPEQFRSRQEQSAMQMRKQTLTDGTDVPDAVPPASLVGSLTPGCSADRVTWRVSAIDISRNRNPEVFVRVRNGRDCQSLGRFTTDEKQTLATKAISASAAGRK